MADELIPTETGPDRREMLSQALSEVETPSPAPEPAPAAAAPTESPDERPRGPDGKFLAKDPAAQPAPARAAQEPADEPVWKRPPSSWKKDYHEKWGLVPDEVKEYAWQREQEMRQGIEPLLPKAQFADAMQKAIAPYEQTIRGLGVDPPTAVAALMQADHTLRYSPPEQKRAYLLQLASQYGVDLSGAQPDAAPINPLINQLQNEILNIRGEVVGWKQRQEEQANQSLKDEIEAFAPTAEHFEAVRPMMVSLLESGVASNLKEAYDKAIRLDDNLFDQIQSGRQAQEDQARRAAADQAAKTAKRAAVSVKSSTPGAATPSKAQDRRSVLLEQFDGLSERL